MRVRRVRDYTCAMIDQAVVRDLALKVDTFAKSAQPFITQQGFILTDFVSAYLSADVYPDDWLESTVYRLIDVKLQLMYVTFDLGMMNEYYFEFLSMGAPETSPRLMLRRMAFEQSIIGRARITWEKLMRFVYYLENGRDIEAIRSIKKRFFSWIDCDARPEWRFLLPYEDMVERHDERFRTPEYHKNSKVRGHLTGAQTVDLNEIIDINNRVNNVIWPNVMAIISGGWPSRFTDLHLSAEGRVDSKYLPPETPEIGNSGDAEG